MVKVLLVLAFLSAPFLTACSTCQSKSQAKDQAAEQICKEKETAEYARPFYQPDSFPENDHTR